MKIIILKPPWRDSTFVFKVKIALKVAMRRAKQKPEEKNLLHKKWFILENLTTSRNKTNHFKASLKR